MVFQIQRGLFSSEFADYYALLGMPLFSDGKDVRKSYLKIARRLHPDSAALNSSDKQFAEQLLSKLINPAWECLVQEKSKNEYDLVLRLKAKEAAGNPNSTEGLSSIAQALFDKSDAELEYRALVQSLTAKQFENLSQCEEVTAQISELNLVYLIKTEGNWTSGGGKPMKPMATPSPAASETSTAQPPINPYAARQSLADPYFNRAEIAFKRQNYPQAVLELRDALKLEPNNGRSHSLLGMVYLEQKQGTMARIHFDKALSLNASDAMALEGKQMLQKMTSKSSTVATAKGSTNAKDGGKSPGMFGGLFGKKK
ncbi:MAG: J domain-containing protein [Alkalinema sp. CAN_BIN05]|nr:J domain-containing protein [Alkalinema sp. CAN_BIN05]